MVTDVVTDVVTSATDKRVRVSHIWVNFDYRLDVLNAAGIYTNDENSSTKFAATPEMI